MNASANNSDRAVTIDTVELLGPDALHNTLDVPQQLLEMFAYDDGQVRVTSSVHMNVEGLFPEGLPSRNE